MIWTLSPELRKDENNTNTAIYQIYLSNCFKLRGCSRGVMINALYFEIVVSTFILQSRDYIHLWTNTLGKGINLFILPAMG